MVLGRRFVLKHHFEGNPKREDFDLVKEDLPPLKENEIQFRALFLSVDPYMRPYTKRMSPPFTMIGSSVAEVEESRNPNFKKGQTIVILAGWVERGIVNPDAMGKNSPGNTLGGVMPAPDLGPKLSKSLLLGACGMPGNTAYFGFLELCNPQPGETVVVSGAAGAVGSLVGQIAKIKGCRVIGYAGDDDKCAWLKSIGYDEAFNYKKVGVAESLAKAAPKGVDCYFDNVGGEMTAAVMMAMNVRGRAAICGAISHYNEKGEYSKVTDILPIAIHKELKIEGFLVGRWKARWVEGIKAMAAWVNSDQVKVKETVVEGFDKMPEAFMGLFTGQNTGKMIVKA